MLSSMVQNKSLYCNELGLLQNLSMDIRGKRLRRHYMLQQLIYGTGVSNVLGWRRESNKLKKLWLAIEISYASGVLLESES